MIRKTFLSLLLLLIGTFSYAQHSFQVTKRYLKKQAIAAHISSATIHQAFLHLHAIKKVIYYNRHQPEFHLTAKHYLAELVNKNKVKKGRYFYHHDYHQLKHLAHVYQVQPAYMIAIWGIETDYGRHIGKYPNLSSLATLIYRHQRSHYFTGEFIARLKMMDQGYNKPYQLLGSWAGAMGQCQYMPSTFLAYAVSYSGHGPKDIWRNHLDALASIANFFHHYHWNPKEIAAIPVRLPRHFNRRLIGLKKSPKPLIYWLKSGVHTRDNIWPGAAHSPIRLIQPDKGGQVYMISNNFDRIMKWNDSVLYALAISEMARDVVQN